MVTPLRLARELREMSQGEVADAVGIERSHYNRIESASRSAGLAVAKRLAEFFGPPLTRDHILFPEEHIKAGRRRPAQSRPSPQEA